MLLFPEDTLTYEQHSLIGTCGGKDLGTPENQAASRRGETAGIGLFFCKAS